jgi:hypothetical protein
VLVSRDRFDEKLDEKKNENEYMSDCEDGNAQNCTADKNEEIKFIALVSERFFK